MIPIGAFGALSHGIIVSCAVGNEGPNSSSVSNSAPWLLTVFASIFDRNILAIVELGNGATYIGQSLYTGEPPQPRHLPLMYSGLCKETTINMQNVEGKIVICQESLQQEQPFLVAVVAATGGAAEIKCIKIKVAIGSDRLTSFFQDPALAVRDQPAIFQNLIREQVEV
ncbi:hypothetical protein L7F22_049476 [Adiantum nelumboides]|nr:hypothetical protein [Adiantum nelumboides]